MRWGLGFGAFFRRPSRFFSIDLGDSRLLAQSSGEKRGNGHQHAGNYVRYVLTAAITLTLIANTFMTSIANFSLYYSSVLGGLIIFFLVFADIAIRTD